MTEIQIIYNGPIVNRAEAKSQGLTQYFTGNPCVHGHIDLRWTCSARCKMCQRKSTDKHVEENKEKYDVLDREYSKRNWAENKEELKVKNKKWRDNNQEYNKQRMLRYQSENPEYFREYQREYLKTPIGKMVNHMSSSMRRVLRGASDSYSTKKLGYTSFELKSHIEKQFSIGMSWDNYGDWEIDHKIPLRWYFYNGIDDPKIVNSLDNLQPLWKSENRSKGGKYEPEE